MESFLRGNLQVKFGGRRASTQPYEYSDYNSSDEQSLTFDSYTIPEDVREEDERPRTHMVDKKMFAI